MAYLQQAVRKVDDKYVCPICFAVFKCPVTAPCRHTFCEACVCRLIKSAESGRGCGPVNCPICRTEFLPSHLTRHLDLQHEINGTAVICGTCGLHCNLPEWDQHSALHTYTQPPPQHQHHPHNHKSPPAPNRSTFSCPLCAEKNLTCQDLLSHVNNYHTNTRAMKVCPVCVSMPWGVAGQVSQDIVQHLNLRHKFEYNTYVDYQCDEEASLQAAIKASIKDC